MQLTDFILTGLERAKIATDRVLDGLTQQEIAWRPGPEANSIGIIIFHQARSEDNFVHTRIQGKTQLWETEKWYEKLNLPVSETGSGYTVEQCAAFRVPELKDIRSYAQVVRNRTVEHVKSLSPAGFDKIVNHPRLGDMSVGAMFALTIVHSAQHAGEISYLRGLQRGMNK